MHKKIGLVIVHHYLSSAVSLSVPLIERGIYRIRENSTRALYEGFIRVTIKNVVVANEILKWPIILFKHEPQLKFLVKQNFSDLL